MSDEIETAINDLAKKTRDAKTHQEALHLSQAALNLAHTKQVLSQVKSE